MLLEIWAWSCPRLRPEYILPLCTPCFHLFSPKIIFFPFLWCFFSFFSCWISVFGSVTCSIYLGAPEDPNMLTAHFFKKCQYSRCHSDVVTETKVDIKVVFCSCWSMADVQEVNSGSLPFSSSQQAGAVSRSGQFDNLLATVFAINFSEIKTLVLIGWIINIKYRIE